MRFVRRRRHLACTAGNAASVRHDQPGDWSCRFIQSIGESREVSHCFARYLQSYLRSREELVEHLIGAPLLCRNLSRKCLAFE